MIVAALAVAGCGSATRTEAPSGDSQQKQRKLVVWDWKSGEPAAAAYIAKAKAGFANGFVHRPDTRAAEGPHIRPERAGRHLLGVTGHSSATRSVG
ncbi:hypothetical protein SAMN05444920_1594 [Nonomuraea solani]|uniref:Uncharacterized protein n=1 Tax=Nonomuraea solani TaxID=1144553 RepID=A0A1H6F1U7_9ACTN|nr:hypothetical protein [Nonomuraea solani]SEH04100.1 hypothetical protein SAMN05444920_1594 [Nonomuraea solani]